MPVDKTEIHDDSLDCVTGGIILNELTEQSGRCPLCKREMSQELDASAWKCGFCGYDSTQFKMGVL